MTRITTKEALKPRFITELAFKSIKIISSRRWRLKKTSATRTRIWAGANYYASQHDGKERATSQPREL